MFVQRTPSPTNLELVQPTPKTALTNANVTALQQAAAAIGNNNGVIDLRSQGTVEIVPYAKTSNVTVTAAADSGAGEAWIFNEDTFNSTVTENAKITTTYNDGFSGKNINRIIDKANMGRGLNCTELTIIAKNSAGEQDDAMIEQMDFTIQGYNPVQGKEMPYVLDLAEALRNTAFKDGMVTVKCDFWINSSTQANFQVPQGSSFDLKLKWAPQKI